MVLVHSISALYQSSSSLFASTSTVTDPSAQRNNTKTTTTNYPTETDSIRNYPSSTTIPLNLKLGSPHIPFPKRNFMVNPLASTTPGILNPVRSRTVKTVMISLITRRALRKRSIDMPGAAIKGVVPAALNIRRCVTAPVAGLPVLAVGVGIDVVGRKGGAVSAKAGLDPRVGVAGVDEAAWVC